MNLSRHFISTDGLDVDDLLRDWRWLVGEGRYVMHKATAMGGLFLRAADGGIYFLDPTFAVFRCVADSSEELEGLLDDRHKRRELLLSFFVRELRERRIQLAPGECYGCKIPPNLGGKLEAENMEATDLLTHLSVLGQLHEQTRRLKPGTVIEKIRVVAPRRSAVWGRLWAWLGGGRVG